MANIYFGNVRKAQYIPAPKAGMDVTAAGYSEAIQYLNGGAFVAQSTGSSRKFPMAWDVTPKESLDCLNQFRNGDYGNGLVYWIDPFASNPVPPHWANPSLTTRGWPSLVSASVRASAVPTPPVVDYTGYGEGTYGGGFYGGETSSLAYNMPHESAKFSLTGAVNAEPKRRLMMLIPPDKVLNIGFTGSAVNAAVMCQPIFLDGSLPAPIPVTLLASSGAQRYNVSISGAAYKAAYFYLTPTVAGGGTIVLTSTKAYYSAIGESVVNTGNHVAGEGSTGCRMSDVTWVYVQAARNRKLVTAATTLTEIGAWL